MHAREPFSLQIQEGFIVNLRSAGVATTWLDKARPGSLGPRPLSIRRFQWVSQSIPRPCLRCCKLFYVQHDSGALATKWFIGRAHLRLWTAFSNNPIGPLCSPLWSRDPPLATPASRISTYSQLMHMPLCPGPDVPVRISYNTRASLLCNFGTKRPIQSSSSKGH